MADNVSETRASTPTRPDPSADYLPQKSIGKINFLEIPVYDIEQARKFYTDVLDWECKSEAYPDAGAGLHAMYFFSKGDVLHGAFNHIKDGKAMRNYNEHDPEVLPLFPTVEVADCAETLAKAEANGGKIHWYVAIHHGHVSLVNLWPLVPRPSLEETRAVMLE